ncbi:Os09g0126250 [Oryza sativa Japonica Group]|uniref:Os09g0126250 protein n=1 Tax=Oryza sativa subsp. japonica TaxID=39947 RepID=A0A0P0XK97_ORYSJ|nr:hypothetical protein EE612_046108 [Oryza sativa]BAT06910.1 Os09g0126250 [Oryza sativa Japonica Group]
MVFPAASRQRTWKSSNTSLHGWCTTATTVMPSLAARPMMRLMTWKEAALSRPLVGSSRNSSRGRVRMSRQMLNRFCCPPLMPLLDRPPIRVSSVPVSPISLTVSSARRNFSAIVMVSGSWICAE